MKYQVSLNHKQVDFLLHCMEEWATADGDFGVTPDFLSEDGKHVVLKAQQLEELYLLLNRGALR